MQSDARIIWVSDDPPTTAELRSRTHRAVTVDPCSDPDTVLDRLESGAYDGIVSAYDLPKQNGIDLLRRVRANHPDVPFVLITDSGSETVARQAINAGVTAYVQADVQPNPYDAAVEQLTETMPKRLEQQRYETILETIDEAVYVLDTDGRIEYVNRRYAEMKGVSREALLGTSIERWADAETLDTARKMAAEIDSGARTVGVLEYEFRTADGEAIPAELRFTSIEFGDGTVGRVGVIRDLSETKQRQQELQRQERIIEASGDAVYALDSAGRFTFVNSTLLEMTGYDEAELLGAHASMLLDRADVRRGEQVIAALLTAEEANEREILEMEIETKDGARIPCETHIALLPFDEEFRGTVGVIRNISDRRERERRLERTETQLSAIFENSPDVITLHRPDGTFLRANCQFVRGTGYDESELDSISVWSLDEQTPTETIGSVWESMEPGDTRRVEVSIRCRNGTALPLEINLARVTIAGEDRFLAIGRDISRRKRQEQQLVALGNVLRHNLRNELTVIQGCADEITRTADAETTEAVETIRERMRSLLTTAEKQRAVVGLLVDPPDRQVIDLEAMLTSIVEGARTEYSTAAIETDCVGDCSIRAVSQIRCAFVELLDNALTHNTEGDPTVEITVTEDDAGVTVRICDNGPPIPEHEFRTLTGERELSEVYHGTGMGLWLVYLAVGVSGGTIDFTQEGCGNTITLEFDRPDHRT